jgi:hypothetical protein
MSVRRARGVSMPKPKKPKTIRVKKVRNPERAAAIRRFLANISFAFLFAALLGAAFYVSRQYVEKKVAFPSSPPKVALKDRPAWMSDLLADEIIRAAKPMGAHSAFDHQMLVDIDRILRASPWIRQVKSVRRLYRDRPGDTIEIDCDYRAPVALVQWRDYFWLVDGEGVQLPAQFTVDQLPRVVFGANHKMNIRIISGCEGGPMGSGKKWAGDDLHAGLDMVKLLYGEPWAEEIVQINVNNFNGRESLKEAYLTLGTKQGTLVKWGRPINGGADSFIEISTQRKLSVLKQIVADYGHIDAGRSWVDIRFDLPTYPIMAQNQ